MTFRELPLAKTIQKTILTIIALFLLSACETTPVKQATTVWDDPLWQRQYQQLKTIEQFQLKGRIGITHPQDSFSSNFLWQQQAHNHFDFRLYGAFGQTYAIMKVTPMISTLDTGDERHFEGTNPEYLLYSILGWSLPINYLQDWVKGLPTGISQNNLLINADGTLQQLTYQDYVVTYERYAEFQLASAIEGETVATKLPTKIKILQGDNKVILSNRSWDMNSTTIPTDTKAYQ
ncbi:MAG: outer membrane lipoprotein LolB [Kangiellaceae bacterium]|nr:outer membrane lipoprotein LolB [Kangiellaceae bacterium]